MREVIHLIGDRGLRPDELAEARLEDYEAAKRTLRVRYPRPREVPLSEEAFEALER